MLLVQCLHRWRVRFCPLDDVLTNIVACRVARHSLDHIPEIVGRHAQFVGAILYGRYAKRQLQLFLIIIPKQVLEFCEYVRVLQLSGNELTVVKTPAEIENQSDILHKNGILELIAFLCSSSCICRINDTKISCSSSVMCKASLTR